jgi:uncharacterized membrane protein
MFILILGLVIFLGMHSLQIVRPEIRARVIERGGGVGAWAWPYFAVAGVGFVLIIVGYAQARPEAPVVYSPPPELRHVALLIMVPVFPLLIASYTRGRIRKDLGHPMLIATILWAIAHLLVNGTLADMLLFGSFLTWAAIDWRSLITRQPQPDLRPANASWGFGDAVAVGGGLAIYAAVMLGLHALLFGVSPI